MSKISLRKTGFRALLLLSAFAWHVAGAGGAAAQTPAQPVAVGGACDTARYKALLQVPIDSMGQGEFPYFMDLDGQCRERKRTLAGSIAGSVSAFNVCAHPPYATLQTTEAPSAMSEREYKYFIEVDRECAAYRRTAGTPPPQPQPARQRASPSIGQQFLTSLVVLGSLITTLVVSLD